MRIVTWNACRGQFDRKASFLSHLSADIAVIQEIAKPKQPLANVLWFGDNPNQGVAIVAQAGYRISSIQPISDCPRYVIPVQVTGPTSFVLLAVCTMNEKPYPYVRAACRAIDVYERLFHSGDIVMAGDFNSNAIWNRDHPADLNHSAMVARLKRLGLVSAYHAHSGENHGEESRHTFYYHWKRDRKFHIDYCFIPEKWLPALQDVDIGSFAAWQKCSDHRPLLVTLDL